MVRWGNTMPCSMWHGATHTPQDRFWSAGRENRWQQYSIPTTGVKLWTSHKHPYMILWFIPLPAVNIACFYEHCQLKNHLTYHFFISHTKCHGKCDGGHIFGFWLVAFFNDLVGVVKLLWESRLQHFSKKVYLLLHSSWTKFNLTWGNRGGMEWQIRMCWGIHRHMCMVVNHPPLTTPL